MNLIFWLNRIDLEKIRLRARVSCEILFLILLLDFHRYGAWYTGNEATLKPYGFSLLCLASLAPVIYSAAFFIQYLVREKWHTTIYYLIYLLPVYFVCLPASFVWSLPFIFNLDPAWYDKDIFRSGYLFYKGVFILLGFPLSVCLFIYFLSLIFKCVWRLSEKFHLSD